MADNLAWVGDDRAGEVRVRPAQRGVRHGGHGHDRVPGAGERHAERGACSPGTDDADREPGRAAAAGSDPEAPGWEFMSGFILFQSSAGTGRRVVR